MFGIDGPEFVVILIVLIVVVGPKDLPKMLKALGKATARMRTTANEFRRQFDEAMHEAELDDLQKTISDVKDLDPRKKLTEIFDPIRDVAKDVKASIDVNHTTDGQTTDDKLTSSDSQDKSDAENGEKSGKNSATVEKNPVKTEEKPQQPVEQSSVRITDEAKFQSATAPKATAAAGLGEVVKENEAKPEVAKSPTKPKKTAVAKNRPMTNGIVAKSSLKSKRSIAGKVTANKPKGTTKAMPVGQQQKTVKPIASGAEKTTIARSSNK